MEWKLGMPLSSPETLHGQLQRGLGRGARALMENPEHAYLLHNCIVHDPRFDNDTDSRTLYYAHLAYDLQLDLEPLRVRLQTPLTPSEDGEDYPASNYVATALTRNVLEALVRLGRKDALDILREYMLTGETYRQGWGDTLVALAEHFPPEDMAELVGLAVERLDDETLAWHVDLWEPCWKEWAEFHPRIRAAWDELERLYPPSKERSQKATVEELTNDELLQLLHGRVRNPPACKEIGRRGDERLFTLAESPDRPSSVSLALRYFQGPGLLEHARKWSQSADAFLRELGRDLRVERGGLEEIPLMVELIREYSLPDEVYHDVNWCAMVKPFIRLGELHAPEVVPLALEMWPVNEYGYLRSHLLQGVLNVSPTDALPLAQEGLWDSEEAVRELAARTAPLTSETLERLRFLAQDVLEDPAVRQAATERLQAAS